MMSVNTLPIIYKGHYHSFAVKIYLLLRFITGILALLLLDILPSVAQSGRFIERRKEVIRNDTSAFFYKKSLDYGVQDLMNPAYVIANNGFDILQLGGYDKRVGEMSWKTNFQNVADNLIHPVNTINAIGWKRFVTSEVLPLNFTPDGAQWVPNYFLHLLGTGMQYRMMTEWYRAHQVPSPKTFAVLTMLSAQFLNEVVENKGFKGLNADPIADWYLFNVAGIFLFNSVKVSRFFSEKCNMADWSFMPGMSFREFSVENSGQWFIYKWYFKKRPKLGVFTRWGMGTYAGLTYRVNKEHSITFSAGPKSNQYELLSEVGKLSTISMTWGAFMAWDKNNTPLVTLQLSGSENALANLNFYPGVIRLGRFSPGVWAQVGTDGTGSFGLCSRYSLGLGAGYGWK